MNIYYNEKPQTKKAISSSPLYNKELDKRKYNIINYLISILGDVELSDEMLNVFIDQFSRAAGRYSVMVEPDTIIGMYNITSINENLSPAAINELWPKYIKDLFIDYKLLEKLNKYETIFGKNDETFRMYLRYIEDKSKEQQKKFDKEAKKLDDIKEEYSEKFIRYLESLIKRQHISFDNIKECLPQASIIEQDESQLREISSYHRIHFGLCNPISYSMVESLIKRGNIDDFDEQPKYYIDISDKYYPTVFTKQDFLNSVEERKNGAKQYKKEG